MKSFQQLIHQETDKLRNCVHCGLCLDSCPTYKISGDENNSPRGRLAIWRGLSENRISNTKATDFYLNECIGCYACETACPAEVPYRDLLEETKKERAKNGMAIHWKNTLACSLIKYPKLLNILSLPMRFLRNINFPLPSYLFRGNPAITISTSQYAKKLSAFYKPTGKKVALFTGCLMENVFKEINFATVRVLIINNFQVIVPEKQVCCGAVFEHSGVAYPNDLLEKNQRSFKDLGVNAVITNSSGCGLSLFNKKQNKSLHIDEIVDVIDFLNQQQIKKGSDLTENHLYYDIPCHLYHGLKKKLAPQTVLTAINISWSLTPEVDSCCGSGGMYQFTHKENARSINRKKAEFLAQKNNVILATSNHVCMMHWNHAIAFFNNSIKKINSIHLKNKSNTNSPLKKPLRVLHLVQCLDEAYKKSGLY